MEQELNSLLHEGKSFVVMWKKNLWVMVVSAMLGLIIGCLLNFYPEQNVYYSTTQIYSLSMYGNEMNAMTDLVKSNKIVEKAELLIGDPELTKDDIKKMIYVEYSSVSRMLSIYTNSKDPEEAIIVGNTVVKVFINEVNNQRKKESLFLLEESDKVLVSQNGVRDMWTGRILVTFVFALLGALILVIRKVITKELLIVEDFTCDGELEVIGLIPRFNK